MSDNLCSKLYNMPPIKPKPTFKQRSRAWIKQGWIIRLASRAASGLLALIAKSWRPTVIVHPETQALLNAGQPVLYAVWHGRMFCLLRSVDPAKTAILISGSNDGEFITQAVKPLGFTHFIRGSSKRYADRAARGIVQAVNEQRLSVVNTVDGPMGPRYTIKPNLVRLAHQLQVPVVPISASAKPNLFWLRQSWDHYMGPNLFSRLTIVIGQPVYMANMPDTAAVQRLETTLLRSTALLDSRNGFLRYWQANEYK
jgi:lysophospholipid acyltransferase (LPLAT)-like uncharacterized protein